MLLLMEEVAKMMMEEVAKIVKPMLCCSEHC
jgi:hypothetical protein